MYSLSPEVPVPRRQTKDSAGYDFYMPYDLELEPDRWYVVNTQICLDGNEKIYTKMDEKIVRPNKWVFLLLPRSSLGYKYGFSLANTCGVIDQDYLKVPITAKFRVKESVTIHKGDRFMQGIFVPVCYDMNEDTPTKERAGGTGSTDVKDEGRTYVAEPPKSSDDKSVENPLVSLLANLTNSKGADAPQIDMVALARIGLNILNTMEQSGLIEYLDATYRKQQDKDKQ